MTQNLSSYYVFYMVAKTGNISAASKELFISQPAVSKSITKLESNLDTKLLVRSSRGVTLTREGQILYDRLSDAFHAIELGEEQLKYESKMEIQHLTIGASTTLCKYILLPYLKEFAKKNPYIRISIECMSTYDTIQALKEGIIDVGLVGEPEKDPALVFSKIRSIEDIFITTQSYMDNLTIQTGIDYLDEHNTLNIFKDATLMLMDKENLSRQYIDQYINVHGIQASNLIEVSTMDLLIEFAKTGIGVACVIKDFVDKELKESSIVEIPMPFSIPKRNIGLIYKKKQYKNPALDALLSFYNESIHK